MAEGKEKSDIARKEEEILSFWKEREIFERSLEKKARKGEFVFYEGPPTANGKPGIHHLEARAFKDVITRYRTMRGYHVRRKGGWDTHGLPVELEVEKELGMKTKKDIESYGIAKFNKRCKENVWKYVEEWERFTDRIGYWVDQKNPYVTYKPEYIESLWWIMKQISERKVGGRKLLYQDYKVIPWCPRCETGLSSHELAQGYQEVMDPSVYVKFELLDEPGTYFLVWTTTPWTLPGNSALAINENINYIVLDEGVSGKYILAKERAEVIFKDQNADFSKTIKGSELVGKKYRPLFEFLDEKEGGKIWSTYPADFVSTEDGTGIVHIAPMYGQDDFELGTKYGLPKEHLVGHDGIFLPSAGAFAGKFVKDADKDIIEDLKKRNILFREEKIKHAYPFCWRCRTALIYYARSSWYLRMSALRDELIRENGKINWEPEHIREGRFGEWLKEVKDWAISRERYWGTPLPVWRSEDGDTMVIGSVNELAENIKRNDYLVMRHGESESNREGVVSSRADNPHHLTDAGKKDVAKSARKLARKNITAIYASPFIRARETAEIVAEVIGFPKERIVFDERIGEINTGVFNLRPVREYRNYFDSVLEKFSKRPEGGETVHDVKTRAGDFIYDVDRKHEKENILIITHEYVAWALEAVVRGLSDAEVARLKIGKDDFIKTAEIRELTFSALPHDKNFERDLHKPFIDECVFTKAGKEWRRVPEVMDVWFDSGAMPLAQDHYPFDAAAKKYVEKLGYPADYISEAIDQTRGWFYTLHAIGILLDWGRAYENVICLGHLLDVKGKKMSKSVGNVVNPWEMLDKYGADTLRFWMYTINQPGESKNFDEKTVAEAGRKTANLVLNVLSFYHLYARSDSFANPKSPHVLDRWIVSFFGKTIEDVTRALDSYKILEAGRTLRDFIGELSQWYVRRSRERFRGDDEKDAQYAEKTLSFILSELSKALAPFMPFLAERIHQELGKHETSAESVHLEEWPVAISPDFTLLASMKQARTIVEAALSARNEKGIKVRQPLQTLLIKEDMKKEFQALIQDEVNVKEVRHDASLQTSLALDTIVTDKLRKEGALREMIRTIQALRKEAGMKQGEKALLSAKANAPARELLESELEQVKKMTALLDVKFVDALSSGELRDGNFAYAFLVERATY